jgi:hypothetical protein
MKTMDGESVGTSLVATGDGSLERPNAIRLDSWKDIANYLNRSVRTVQRWEMAEAMPVHRHRHGTGGSVYAYPHEVDAWRSSRSQEKPLAPRVSAFQSSPLVSLGRAERSALLRLLEIIVEQLREDATRSVIAPPPDEADGTLAAEDRGPGWGDLVTIGDTIRTPLLVACRRPKVDP